VSVYRKSGHTPKIETDNGPFRELSPRLWRSLGDFAFQKVSQNPKSEEYPCNSKVSQLQLPKKEKIGRFIEEQIKETVVKQK